MHDHGNCERCDWLETRAARVEAAARPIIVCLCGSTRFGDAWKQAYREESLAGRIVLSVGVMVHAGEEPIRDNGPIKIALDQLHLRKIDLADEVLILNVGGYIGDSTRRELAYAEASGKRIRWLEPALAATEPLQPGRGIGADPSKGTKAALTDTEELNA